MTIDKLNEKRDDAQRACDAVAEAVKAHKELGEIVSKLKEMCCRASTDETAKKQAEDLYYQAYTALGAAGRVLNDARNQCYSYKSLLEDIMRNTEVEWPPSCKKARQS